MDREILFRGKRLDNGEWIDGYYVPIGGQYHYIFTGKLDITGLYPTFDRREVAPSTVGRYTGLTDKNGVKIFEGDICKDSMGFVFEVQWDNENARFLGRHEKPRGDVYICYVGRMPAVEVVGNIYDNPELIGGEDDG